MAAYVKQFEEYWVLLTEALDLPEGTKEIMHENWLKINWPTSVQEGKGAGKGKGTGKVNGYILYMKDQLIELNKNPALTGRERMKELARRWKDVSDDQKKEWSWPPSQKECTCK